MRLLINISYCGHHYKGGGPNDAAYDRIHGQAHAEWLEEAVTLWKNSIDDPIICHYFPKVIVSATGFPGICHVEVSPGNLERDVMWRIFGRVPIVGMPQNPSHQEGAAWCIRQGLEYAGKLGYDYMIHTAEDIMPHRGTLTKLAGMLDEGYEYVGERWGTSDLNTQFFACRVQSLVGIWDPGQVMPSAGYVERYMAHCCVGKSLGLIGRIYDHTHDFSEWKRWREMR